MEIEVIRSNRKTVSLEVGRDGSVRVRAPQAMSRKQIEEFVRSHGEWIERAIARQSQKPPVREYTQEQIKEMKAKTAEIIAPKVRYYSSLMGLEPTGVTVTSARSRYGSCSGKNRLCFSFLLAECPDEAVDYVVVHELAHIKHHNHSQRFYALVEKYLPDYRERKKLLG